MLPTQSGIFLELKEEATTYAEDRILLLQLNATKKTARVVGILTSSVLMVFNIFFVFLFGSILAGRYLTELTGNFYIGFGIITGVYVLLFIILFSSQKKIIERKVADLIVRLLMDKTSEGGSYVK